jgi:hypothetical protein
MVLRREMICSLIREQLSKRDDSYGSICPEWQAAVECREASDRESLAPGPKQPRPQTSWRLRGGGPDTDRHLLPA